MAEKIRLANLSDVPQGSGIEVAASGRMFAVYNVDGEIHVMDGVSPHAGGPIGKGQLDGCVVTCPWHGWQFDVTNGQHCLNANLQHPTFQYVVEAGEIFALLED